MSITAIPTQIVLQTGSGTNFLTWNLVAGATTYSVQRSTDGVNFTIVGTPSTNTYLDSSVSVGTNYFYRVASTTVAGTSPYGSSYPLSITPCLPGQINLGYLRYMSKLKADLLNSNQLTTDEWNFNINQSAYELYDILVTKYGDDFFLAAPYVFETTGGQTGVGVYPMPDGSATYQSQGGGTAPAVFKVANVSCGVAVGNNAWVTLPRFNLIDINKFIYPQLTANALGVFNLSYRPMGNNLWFIPAPTAGQFIRLLYVPILNTMLQDTDMMPFSISGWSELVMLDAAIKALIKQESFEQAAALKVFKDTMMERIETTAANRDVGQPNTVSDTRANTGFYDANGFSGNGGGMGGW